MDLWTVVGVSGIITAPMILLLSAMRMMLRGSLVPRQQMLDRLADRDLIISSKDSVIEEQSGYIRVLEGQVELVSQGNRTTLQVVEALPHIASTPNRSGPS